MSIQIGCQRTASQQKLYRIPQSHHRQAKPPNFANATV